MKLIHEKTFVSSRYHVCISLTHFLFGGAACDQSEWWFARHKVTRRSSIYSITSGLVAWDRLATGHQLQAAWFQLTTPKWRKVCFRVLRCLFSAQDKISKIVKRLSKSWKIWFDFNGIFGNAGTSNSMRSFAPK